MLESLIKPLFLIIFLEGFSAFGASQAFAANSSKEIYLREMNERISNLLKHSTEAEFFLGEDLTEALATLAQSRLQWTETLNPMPLLFEEAGRSSISLSTHYSFMALEEEQVKLVLELLFHIQRQLEGSLLPIPELRINLFAKKFSPNLLSSDSICSLSLYPIPFPLTSAQREKFTTELLSLMRKKGYHFKSRWASKIMWLESRSLTDAECGGNNRNLQIIKAHITDIRSKKGLKLGEKTSHSCGHEPIKIDRALKKIIKDINTNLPKCNNAFWI